MCLPSGSPKKRAVMMADSKETLIESKGGLFIIQLTNWTGLLQPYGTVRICIGTLLKRYYCTYAYCMTPHVLHCCSHG